MFNFALRLTEEQRVVHGRGAYIGLGYVHTKGQGYWDDGTLPAVDTPYKTGHVGRESLTLPYGLLSHTGSIKWHEGTNKKTALCGNYDAPKTEAFGRTRVGQRPDSVTSRLAIRKALSHEQCALLCGMDYRCRLAEFNSVLSTCVTLEAGSYLSLTPSGYSTTFIRDGFVL